MKKEISGKCSRMMNNIRGKIRLVCLYLIFVMGMLISQETHIPQELRYRLTTDVFLGNPGTTEWAEIAAYRASQLVHGNHHQHNSFLDPTELIYIVSVQFEICGTGNGRRYTTLIVVVGGSDI